MTTTRYRAQRCVLLVCKCHNLIQAWCTKSTTDEGFKMQIDDVSAEDADTMIALVNNRYSTVQEFVKARESKSEKPQIYRWSQTSGTYWCWRECLIVCCSGPCSARQGAPQKRHWQGHLCLQSRRDFGSFCLFYARYIGVQSCWTNYTHKFLPRCVEMTKRGTLSTRSRPDLLPAQSATV